MKRWRCEAVMWKKESLMFTYSHSCSALFFSARSMVYSKCFVRLHHFQPRGSTKQSLDVWKRQKPQHFGIPGQTTVFLFLVWAIEQFVKKQDLNIRSPKTKLWGRIRTTENNKDNLSRINCAFFAVNLVIMLNCIASSITMSSLIRSWNLRRIKTWPRPTSSFCFRWISCSFYKSASGVK